jgi:hypothetical protein
MRVARCVPRLCGVLGLYALKAYNCSICQRTARPLTANLRACGLWHDVRLLASRHSPNPENGNRECTAKPLS